MAYIRTAQAGNFSDPNTWVGGVVPTTGDYACSISHRVTLDADTGAHLCVNQTDWVSAGGSAIANWTGGFTLPSGATRVIGGDVRYDGTGSGGEPTTPIYVSNGSLTINGGIIFVAGYTPASTTICSIISVNPTTTAKVTLVINGNIELKRGTDNTAGLYYRRLISVNPYTNGDMALTMGSFIAVSTGGNIVTALYVGSTASKYDITFKGNVFGGYNVLYSQLINIGCNSTGNADQNITFLGTVLGNDSSTGSYKAIDIANAHNITFANKATINNVHTGVLIAVASLRGTFSAPLGFSMSSVSKAYLSISLGNTASAVNIGDIDVVISTNNSTASALSLSGSGSCTIGNISIDSQVMTSDSTALISLSNTGAIAVGNISFLANGYNKKSVLSISSSRTAATTLGSIDTSLLQVSSSSGNNIVNISGNNQAAFTITGNITASSLGSTVADTASVIAFNNSTAGQYPITINGNVIGGSTLRAISVIDGVALDIIINGDVTSAPSRASTLLYPPVIRCVGSAVRLNRVLMGTSGRFPIEGYFVLNSSSTGTVDVYDKLGTKYTMSAQPLGAMPSPIDVRFGTAVGNSVGTLRVPSASFVMKDVSVDATVGTLDVFSNVSNLVAKLQSGGVKARSKAANWNNVTLHIAVNDDLDVYASRTDVGFDKVSPYLVPVSSSIYGTNSLTYRGMPTIRFNGGYIATTNPNNKAAMAGDTDWTVELAFRLDALPTSDVYMLFQYTQYMNVEVRPDGGIGVWFSSYSNNSYNNTVAGLITANRFYSLVMQRSGNTISLYIDGVRYLTIPLILYTTSLFGYLTRFIIGHDVGVASRKFFGYMQDIVVTDGVAKYSGTTCPVYDTIYPYNGALSPLSTSTIAEQMYSLYATNTQIQAKTSQLSFTSNGVLADAGSTGGSGGSATDYTSRFNALDTAVAAANTAIAGVKTKTDQLSFSSGTVNANAAGTNYAGRFDSIDEALLALSLTDYSDTLSSISNKIDLISVPTNDLTAINASLSNLATAISTVYSKVSPLSFTATGVVADVTVSVQQVINYDSRFDGIEQSLTNITSKVNPLSYGTNGVMATANVDISPLSTTLSSGLTALTQSMTPRFNSIDTKLVEIGNAAGAIDLTPITDSLDDIYASTAAIPRLDYTATFVGVVNKLNDIKSKTDTITALSAAVSNIPTTNYSGTLATLSAAIAAIPTTDYSSALSTITTKVNAIPTTTYGSSLAALSTKIDAIPTTDYTGTLDAITNKTLLTYNAVTNLPTCDVSPVLAALAALDSRFNQVSAGGLTLVPQATPDKTTIYGHCKDGQGNIMAGVEVKVKVQQASGYGSLYSGSEFSVTSDSEGLIVFTISRDPTTVISVILGNRVERFKCNGAETQAIPSMVALPTIISSGTSL